MALRKNNCSYQFRQIFLVILLIEVELDLGVVGMEADGALLGEVNAFGGGL